LASAKEAAEAGDHQWVAELTTHLIRNDNEDLEARRLKAAALRQLGFARSNINWRSWYLTSAQELEGTIDFSNATDLAAPDLLRTFPTSELVNGMRFRLQAENTLDVHMTMGLRVPDVDEGYGLEIRRGVAQYHDSLPENADVVLEIDRSTLESILVGDVLALGIDGIDVELPQQVLPALFQSGKARLSKGSMDDLKKFLGYFDPLSKDPVPLTVR
jgi:alkyl sulfatase BDS1-like metallo-beta-lactamase superfamily hydrolase